MRLGATRTSLNIDKGVTDVQFASKHPLEFQIGYDPVTLPQIPHDFDYCRFIVFFASQRQQFGDFIQTPVKIFQPMNHRLQLSTLFAERLRQKIERTPIEHAGNTFFVSSSFGVAQLGEDEDAADLLARADALLYRAKERGRNCVCTG